MCLDPLMLLQGVANLGGVYAVLPGYSSLEWAYADTSQKWLEECAFIRDVDIAGWITHFLCLCNSG